MFDGSRSADCGVYLRLSNAAGPGVSETPATVLLLAVPVGATDAPAAALLGAGHTELAAGTLMTVGRLSELAAGSLVYGVTIAARTETAVSLGDIQVVDDTGAGGGANASIGGPVRPHMALLVLVYAPELADTGSESVQQRGTLPTQGVVLVVLGGAGSLLSSTECLPVLEDAVLVRVQLGLLMLAGFAPDGANASVAASVGAQVRVALAAVLHVNATAVFIDSATLVEQTETSAARRLQAAQTHTVLVEASLRVPAAASQDMVANLTTAANSGVLAAQLASNGVLVGSVELLAPPTVAGLPAAFGSSGFGGNSAAAHAVIIAGAVGATVAAVALIAAGAWAVIQRDRRRIDSQAHAAAALTALRLPPPGGAAHAAGRGTKVHPAPLVLGGPAGAAQQARLAGTAETDVEIASPVGRPRKSDVMRPPTPGARVIVGSAGAAPGRASAAGGVGSGDWLDLFGGGVDVGGGGGHSGGGNGGGGLGGGGGGGARNSVAGGSSSAAGYGAWAAPWQPTLTVRAPRSHLAAPGSPPAGRGSVMGQSGGTASVAPMQPHTPSMARSPSAGEATDTPTGAPGAYRLRDRRKGVAAARPTSPATPVRRADPGAANPSGLTYTGTQRHVDQTPGVVPPLQLGPLAAGPDEPHSQTAGGQPAAGRARSVSPARRRLQPATRLGDDNDGTEPPVTPGSSPARGTGGVAGAFARSPMLSSVVRRVSALLPAAVSRATGVGGGDQHSYAGGGGMAASTARSGYGSPLAGRGGSALRDSVASRMSSDSAVHAMEARMALVWSTDAEPAHAAASESTAQPQRGGMGAGELAVEAAYAGIHSLASVPTIDGDSAASLARPAQPPSQVSADLAVVAALGEWDRPDSAPVEHRRGRRGRRPKHRKAGSRSSASMSSGDSSSSSSSSSSSTGSSNTCMNSGRPAQALMPVRPVRAARSGRGSAHSAVPEGAIFPPDTDARRDTSARFGGALQSEAFRCGDGASPASALSAEVGYEPWEGPTSPPRSEWHPSTSV
jgi:hypothetical protein